MNLQNWTKKNPYFAALIAAFIAYVAYDQFSGPKTYGDCVLRVVQEAKVAVAASIGVRACREKFRPPSIIDTFKPIPVKPVK